MDYDPLKPGNIKLMVLCAPLESPDVCPSQAEDLLVGDTMACFLGHCTWEDGVWGPHSSQLLLISFHLVPVSYSWEVFHS